MAKTCVVIVREVWDTRDLSGSVLDPSGAVKGGALLTRFEPEDLNALEAALRLKDTAGLRVLALGLGEPGSVDVLRECLYRGADGAYRIAGDPKPLDTAARARLFAAAIRKIGGVDLVLTGTTTMIEGESSLQAAHLAGELGWNFLSYLDHIESADETRLVGKRAVEMGYEFLETPWPCVAAMGVALLEDDPRAPRSAKAMLKLKHKKTEIPAWSAQDLGGADLAPAVLLAGYEAVPERMVETRTVDPENEAALSSMLADARKGD
jgi:electron transfer flavoprotein beta subunit